MTLNEVNVLVGQADWAWSEAVRSIFAPRGINSMVVADAESALDAIESRNIHTAIVDMDSQTTGGLSIVKIIHGHHPMLPTIVVSRSSEQRLLTSVLELNVFSVIAKPVDMTILQYQLNRLFIKMYDCTIFGDS